MRYYHSFPRVSKNSKTDIADGIGVLKSILDFGFLLTPEDLEIPPNPDSDRFNPPATNITQLRGCFTLLTQQDLLAEEGHTELFGKFSIGLNTRAARRLGIVPAIHYYKSYQKASSPDFDSLEDSGVSEDILNRLAELRRIVIVLATLEAASGVNPNEFKELSYLRQNKLVLSDEAKVEALLAKLTPNVAKHVLSYFEVDRVPGWNLAEWIEIILSMFQTADSKRGRHLAYYSQREWRIIQLFAPGLWCFPVAENTPIISDDLTGRIERAVRRARKYFKALPPDIASRLRFQESYLLYGYYHLLFRDFIEEIVVPADAKVPVAKILEERQLPYAAADKQCGKLVFTEFELTASRIPKEWQ